MSVVGVCACAFACETQHVSTYCVVWGVCVRFCVELCVWFAGVYLCSWGACSVCEHTRVDGSGCRLGAWNFMCVCVCSLCVGRVVRTCMCVVCVWARVWRCV